MPSKKHAIYHSFCWIHVQGTIVPKVAYIDNSMYLFSLDFAFCGYIKHYIQCGCSERRLENEYCISSHLLTSLDHDKNNKYFDTYIRPQ